MDERGKDESRKVLVRLEAFWFGVVVGVAGSAIVVGLQRLAAHCECF